MAGIRISGMASGLPPNIVEQMMEAEKIPVKQMESKKAVEDEKSKLVGELETKILEIPKSIAELTSTRGFSSMKLTSGDANILSGTADPSEAVNGTWMIEVNQLAQKPGALSVGFPDADKSQIGVGYLKFKTPDGEKEVYINGQNSTLTGVASVINRAQKGVRAQVVSDRSDKELPFKLLITGLATGAEKQIEFPVAYMLDGDQDFYFEKSRASQNAKIKVDGFEIELAENQAKDVIPGVTLDLKQMAPGREVAITVKEDMEVISGKLKLFVDAYNGVLGWIQNQHKLSKSKDGREHLGPMGGDGLLRSIENDFRRLILSPQFGVEGDINQMNQLGVEFNRNGTLEFKQDKFNKVLNSDPRSVAAFLRGDGFSIGFVPNLKRQISNLTNGSFGGIAMRKKGLNEKIKQLDNRIDQKNKQLEKREESLRTKFSNLESKMAQLNQQGGAIAGMSKGG